jgi:hypothetical protein
MRITKLNGYEEGVVEENERSWWTALAKQEETNEVKSCGFVLCFPNRLPALDLYFWSYRVQIGWFLG